MKKQLYLYLGWSSFGLGFAGIFLPLLPTTIFWILSVWCWTKGETELAKKVLAHPRYGKPVKQFLEHGAISRKGKLTAISSITISYVLTIILLKPSMTFSIVLALILLVITIGLATRPETSLVD